MKIFGKRKNKAAASDQKETTSTPGDDSNSTDKSTKKEEADVPSYFSSADGIASSKKKKQRNAASTNGDDIQALLAMDPSELNSKQRRLVRRHKERDGSATAALAECAEIQPPNEEGKGVAAALAGQPRNDDQEEMGDHDENGQKSPASVGGEGTNPTEQKTTDVQKLDSEVSGILAKLEGLNSKDRRKFLRQLRSSDGGAINEKVIAAAEERAKKVAERNEKEAANVAVACDVKNPKRKQNADDGAAAGAAEPEKKKRKKKKKPAVDLSSLDPEERQRREQQRRMQKEAAERREAGLVDPNRHPLNSERRRANRRKPSKAALIAQAKRERMAERGKFNAVGYQMRRGGGGGGGDDGRGEY